MTDRIQYEIIIGLEIHVQLLTNSKLFCGCTTKFGSPPNTQTCHVCTGMPGALPVLNKQALNLAIKTGLALNCKIEQNTKWDRKNYFYPDLPKGYQISQFDRPICFDGWLELVNSTGAPTDRRVRIERAHLEEDAGKSNHDESGGGGDSMIDLNRAGTPLLEVVTKPDLRNAEDAKNFLNELKLVLTYIEISDCNMQQGNLRVDANVNLLIHEDKVATPIVEIKNLNSFRAVERSINYEVDRQFEIYQKTGVTIDDGAKQTRGWDDDRQITVLQREKEGSADYRYFPDPDLVAIKTTDQTINSIRESICVLPDELRNRLTQSGLSEYDADVLVRQGRGVVEYFDRLADTTGDPKTASNWIQQEVQRFLNENDLSIEDYPVDIVEFSKLLIELSNKNIDQNRGKDVLNAMVADRIGFQDAKEKLGIFTVNPDEIDRLCRQIIADSPEAVADIRSGNSRAIGSLIGHARKLNPNANPNDVRQMLVKLIGIGS